MLEGDSLVMGDKSKGTKINNECPIFGIRILSGKGYSGSALASLFHRVEFHNMEVSDDFGKLYRNDVSAC